jgi:hypothetical protein
MRDQEKKKKKITKQTAAVKKMSHSDEEHEIRHSKRQQLRSGDIALVQVS